MSTPTTEAPKFVETPEQLAWRTELTEMNRLCDIERRLRDEMALLPRTDELMKHYEKIYTEANDNIRRHNYPGMIERITANREKFKLLDPPPSVIEVAMRGFDEEIAGIREKQHAVRDWDKHFLDRKKLHDYCVWGYFASSDGY